MDSERGEPEDADPRDLNDAFAAPEPEAPDPVLGFAPGPPLAGELLPPGSKSVAQRAILAAILADGRTVLRGLPASGDVLSALGVARRCARAFEELGPGEIAIEGHAPTEHAGPAPAGVLAVGESGTLSRLTTAALALAGDPSSCVTLRPSGTLVTRKSPPLFRALVDAGVAIVEQNLPGTWPVTFVPTRRPGDLVLERPVSSQEVSGLLLGLAAFPEPGVVRVRGKLPSAPYVALTLRALADFGATVHVEHPEPDELVYRVQGPLVAPEHPLDVEVDASAAAVGLVAACLTGGEVRVALRSDSAQGDVNVVEHLEAFGCRAAHGDGWLTAGGFPTRGVELDLEGEPDLAPPLAALAAGVALRHGEPCTLRGLATLPGKESDRLTVLQNGLRLAGFLAEAGPDFLRIAPGPHGVGPVVLDPEDDHRMAFAFALLSLVRPNLRVRTPECVAKSWPRFWEDLAGLGAELELR